MEVKVLDVPYHAQTDLLRYCGPACAQMVLEDVRAGVFTQPDLYDDHCHDVTTYWATSPSGLASTLDERSSPALARFFTLHTLDSEEAISRKLCWTIHHHEKPPIVLTRGWGHWIVVVGYVLSAEPTGPGDATYDIEAFDILDPYPVTAGVDTPPYQHEQVQYDDWRTNFLTAVPAFELRGKFVAVCDPDSPEGFAQYEAPDEAGPFLTPEEATEAALAALDQDYLRDRDPWQTASSGTQPLPPLLVEPLAEEQAVSARGASYLVPFQRQDESGAVPLVVRVNPRSGKYQGAIAVPDGSTHLATMRGRDEVIEQYASGNGIAIPGTDRTIYPDPGDLYPNLVWKVCQESLTIYWPFYLFVVGDDRVYIRVDGAVFFELHEVIGN